MSIFQEPGPQDLFEWLEIATRKLASRAKQRICAEVASHYEEAVDGHLQNGLPIEAAQSAALAELGDARAAGRRFRRTHLTVSEFRAVSRLLTGAPRNWVGPSVQAAGNCLICLMTFVNLRLFRVTDSFAYAMVAVLLLSRIIPIVMARRESAAPTPRWLVLMASLNSLYNGLITLFYLLFIFAPNLPLKVQPLVRLALGFFCLAGLYGIARGVWLFGLCKKLGKAGEDWMGNPFAARNEIPPDKPVAS
jgi:hypothetical protein